MGLYSILKSVTVMAGTALVILILPLLLAVARADSELFEADFLEDEVPDGYYTHDTEEEEADTCSAAHLRPKITLKTGTDSDKYRNRLNQSSVYAFARYGEDLSIFCSASETGKITIQNAENLETIQLNSTTGQLCIHKPDLGEHIYRCTDSNTDCQESLLVSVYPTMTVIATDIRQIRGGIVPSYFVPLQQDYEVLCYGNDITSLRMKYFASGELPVYIRNQTVIQHKTRADKVENVYYGCIDIVSEKNMLIQVIVDHFPLAQDFQCFLKESLTLMCSWDSLNKNYIFKLFVIFEEEAILVFYDSSRLSRGMKREFRINAYETYLYNITTLLVETCNDAFCNNQTYFIDYESIFKLDPPSVFILLNTSSSGAAVEWHLCDIIRYVKYEYKLEYRKQGMDWRQVNTSSVLCHGEECQFQLNLCPDTRYEVRLYVKLLRELEDKFWSDPVSMIFVTDPQNTTDVLDPVFELQKPEPITKAERVLNEIKKFKGRIIKANLAIKKRITGMRKRSAYVKVQMDLRKGLTVLTPSVCRDMTRDEFDRVQATLT